MKNNKLFIAVTVILVIAGLIIGYVIGSSKTFEKDSSKNDSLTKSQKINKDSQKNSLIEDEETNKKSEAESEPKQKVVLNTINEKITGLNANYVCTNLVNISSVLYDNGDVYVSIGDLVSGAKSYMDSLFGQETYSLAEKTKSMGEIKLNVSNVSKVLSFGFGQTCTRDVGLAFVKNDGTVSVISYYNILIGKKNVTNISELKNIASINMTAERNEVDAVAIDKSGAKYFLSDYLYKSGREW